MPIISNGIPSLSNIGILRSKPIYTQMNPTGLFIGLPSLTMGFASFSRLIDRVRAEYGNPERIYHGGRHLNLCINTAWKLRPLFSDDNAFMEAFFALLYHDIVYMPPRIDNEERSCEIMESDLSHHYDHSVIEGIKNKIMATKIYYEPCNEDEALVKDIDMTLYAISGTPISDIEEPIHREYAMVREYDRERKKFLRRIFVHPFASDFFNDPRVIASARHNIVRCISRCNPVVAVAGTFDLLHDGHKMLINKAMGIAGESPNGQLHVGIMSDRYAAVNKTHPVQDISTRARQITEHINSVSSSTNYMLHEMSNPTDLVMDIDVLVVSTETEEDGYGVINDATIRGNIPPALSVSSMYEDRRGRVSSTRLRSEQDALREMHIRGDI